MRSKGKTLKQDLSPTPSFFHAQLHSFIPNSFTFSPSWDVQGNGKWGQLSVYNSSLYIPSCLFFSMLYCRSFPWSAVPVRKNWILNRLQFLQGISTFLSIGSSSGCKDLFQSGPMGCKGISAPHLQYLLFLLLLLFAGLVLTLFSSVLNFLWCSYPFLNIFSQELCSMLSSVLLYVDINILTNIYQRRREN